MDTEMNKNNCQLSFTKSAGGGALYGLQADGSGREGLYRMYRKTRRTEMGERLEL